MADWFPSQYPEQVRIAQSTAMARQVRSSVAFIVCMMALGFAVEVIEGSAWPALLVWLCAMGGLAHASFARWGRARELPPPDAVSSRDIRYATLYAALCGAIWTVGLVAWGPFASSQLALMAIAVSMVFTAHAVAACYFVPGAVLAFSVPLLAGSIVVCVLTMDAPVALVGVVLILLHGTVSFWLLKRKWIDFTRAIDVDVERTRLAGMLQDQIRIAEAAVQLKTRFLASASHDLRQPMHAISLYLDGLAAVELPQAVRAVISDARACTHDMIDMFRSLLDISRLDAHQAVPALSVFSMASVLTSVEKQFLPLAASRGISLKVRPCADYVYSDPVMVERIAQNFVSNAVRYTLKGRVLVACRVQGRALRLAVYDTGGGIPESEQQSIFDEFHRLDPSKSSDHTGGLGLGLAIVRRLAQALRLPVVVRSTPGRGSMFAVDLPLVHVSRARAEAPSPEPSLAGRLVVLVEDEVSILHATSLILKAAGCDVIGARSGKEALSSMASSMRVPDVIVCDYELQDSLSGSDVIRHLREEFNSEIPALLVT